ncbi:pyrroline-5-carboxylate reductase dimerization-domain-containing protein, partial [Terfezia claveryi]
LTLTVLGCGTMGVAILSGIIDSLTTLRSGFTTPSRSQHLPGPGTFTPLPTHGAITPPALPPRLPSRFIACVKRKESAVRVRKSLGLHGVEVIENDNIRGVSEGDVVLLGCKPQMCEEILRQEGMSEALEGKLLVSILAGVRLERLRELVPQSTRVVRAMPNTASKIREGMTVISLPPSPPLPASETALITWIFNQIGLSLVLPEKHMDACTALCGSGPAFYALMIEAMSDGGVMMGLPRAEAQMMAAQVMQGAGRMVLRGEHPAIIREQVSTPAGCTIGGLLVLEDGKVRSTVARGIQEATRVAAGLGS